ncbi:hypothetical protein BJV78DRAFT_959601 [Lactifluus subvellereus]|nr:hypothetical protein BJV78DRAFT_959601 [Lactifluus subvellereus]
MGYSITNCIRRASTTTRLITIRALSRNHLLSILPSPPVPALHRALRIPTQTAVAIRPEPGIEFEWPPLPPVERKFRWRRLLPCDYNGSLCAAHQHHPRQRWYERWRGVVQGYLDCPQAPPEGALYSTYGLIAAQERRQGVLVCMSFPWMSCFFFFDLAVKAHRTKR